jgi:Probable zinc-ribbon domain
MSSSSIRPKEHRRRRVERHPLYGDIPLIRETSVGRNGAVHEWWRPDPTFKPTPPRGGVPGDVARQVFCPAHHVPKYFYIDEPRTCIQCAQRFVFRAEEQKYWYETLKFNFASVPVRCLGCRRSRRSERALREQMAAARTDLRQRPTDPAGYLALARSIVEYHERTRQGDLDAAIAAARKAASLWPDTSEPALWEGVAHARAGRAAKARINLERFLAGNRVRKDHATLSERARHYLERLRDG